MTKEYFSVEQLMLMDMPEVIQYAAPVMISLVALEWFITYKK